MSAEAVTASILLSNASDDEAHAILQNLDGRLRSTTLQQGAEATSTTRLCIALCEQIEAGRPSLRANAVDLQYAISFCVLSLIRNARAEVSSARRAVEICVQSAATADIVIRCCLASLSKEAQELHNSSGSGQDDHSKVPLAAEILRDIVHRNKIDPRHLTQGGLEMLTSISEDVAVLLLLTICASSATLFSEARDAFLALMISHSNTWRTSGLVQSGTQLVSLPDLLWTVICRIIRQKDFVHHTTSGYAIWSCAICLEDSFIPQGTFHQEEYWALIREGLAYGTAEQRKYCLTILRSSVDSLSSGIELPSMSFAIKDKGAYIDQYAKYAALFETICLSRYLNQVQASVPDLQLMASSTSKVHSVWIITLLHAALAHGMQDSIRKVIGTWVLEHGVHILLGTSDPTFVFLTRAFLPWATLGYHFTGSIEKDAASKRVCKHGEQLASFTRHLVSSHEYGLGVLQSSLAFIVQKGGHIFPFGRAFLLDGLEKGTSGAGLKLEITCLELVVKIAAIQGFQGMVQDLMILQCDRLRLHSSSCAQRLSNLKPLLRALDAVKSAPVDIYALPMTEMLTALTPDPHTSGPSASVASSDTLQHRIVTVARFAQLLNDTRCKCIWGHGLAAGTMYLLRALESGGFEMEDSAKLAFAIRALWDEIEVQDYPRNVIKAIPHVFFHPASLKICKPESELLLLLSELVPELQRLAENRVYVFAPLAGAFRKVLLQTEEAAELPFADFMVRYANNPPQTRIEFELENTISGRLEAAVPTRTYASYYGKDEAYGHACVFDMLNRLPTTSHWTEQTRIVVNEIMDQWVNQKLPVPVFSRWKTSTQLQVLLLCMERILPKLSSHEVESYLEKLLIVLALEPLPRFRYLLEWIAVRMFIYLPDRRQQLLEDQASMDLTNPKYLVSVMKINLMIACLHESKEAFSLELMTQLIPLAASAKIVIRHEAQWMFPTLWDYAEKCGWTTMLQNPAFKRLNEAIRSLESYINPPVGRLLERFDAVRDHNLTNLFQGDYLRIEPSEPTRLERKDLFGVIDSEPELSRTHCTLIIPLGEASVMYRAALQSETPYSQDLAQEQSSASVPLQTKSSAWKDAMQLLPDTVFGEERHRVHDVILLATYIDNAYNIGGLSRIGEIYGITSLQVRNLRTLASRDFSSVSVASHIWLPIEQLEEGQVSEFLTSRKLEGYTVVGIEQTDRSRVLGREDCSLPRKIVLVLGSEREGIPAMTLAQLDFCVEIKQFGVTRSMNVQTAAAVALYEYARQHSP